MPHDIQGGYALFNGDQVQAVPEQWILGFPRGTFYISKYDSYFTFDDIFYEQIAKAFDSETLSKPVIDRDHNFSDSYGDIIGYKIEPAGMKFKISLTPEGQSLVKNKTYKYHSPAWGKTTDTNKIEFPNRLAALSLTNFPAFEGAIQELQTQLQLSKFAVVTAGKKREAHMELTMLAKTLGLREDVNIESIHKAVVDNQEINRALNQKNGELMVQLKKAEDSAIELSRELQKIKTEEIAKEADGITDKWIECGKLHPAIKEMVMARYMKDKDSTVKEFEAIPEKFHAAEDKQKTGGNHGDKCLVDATEKDKMLKRGLNPNDVDDVAIFNAGKSRRKEV